jgi:RHS repeat-associated protein
MYPAEAGLRFFIFINNTLSLPFGETMAEQNAGQTEGWATPYKFSAKEQDDLTGYYYFGARYYSLSRHGGNPRVSMWHGVDPLAMEYPSWSPYNYTLNNPIRFIDPDGSYVDESEILKKDKKGEYLNKTAAEAYLKFASSKSGFKLLSKYAQKGQTIAGKKIATDGEYHKKGIDVGFTLSNLNYYSTDGESRLEFGPSGNSTLQKSKNDRSIFNVNLNNAKNINNEHSEAFFNNPKSPTSTNEYILDPMKTIFHEMFIHIEPLTLGVIKGGINVENYNSRRFTLQMHLNARKEHSNFSIILPELKNIFKKNNSKFGKTKSYFFNYQD